MTTIDPKNSVLDSLGLKKPERTASDKLGQDQFLELMVAQLKNQDPMKPMENGEFLSQMAQWDPIGEWGGLNLYQFVANSPLYYVDPYGLHWTDYVPNWIFPAANFSAGMGDALTFNLTDHARNWMDIDQVNHCSGWYKGGEVAGTALSFALPAGGVSKVAGGADRVLIGTAESGIYRFAGRTGRNYIGQSGDIATRLGRHASTGKLPPGVNPTTWEVWGGRLARERAEQQLINKEGLRNLENIVNPLGGHPGLYHYVPTVGEAAAAGAAVGPGVGALKGGCNE